MKQTTNNTDNEYKRCSYCQFQLKTWLTEATLNTSNNRASQYMQQILYIIPKIYNITSLER